jgi:hypothetical protein
MPGGKSPDRLVYGLNDDKGVNPPDSEGPVIKEIG